MYDLRVVIADNASDDKKSMKSILSRGGHNVVAEAEDGITALKLIRNFEPDLVILNADLPGMGGIEVAKILEEDKVCPVILISSYISPDIMEEAKDAMVMAYMLKPVDEASLLVNIKIALINYEKVRELQREVSTLTDTLESRKTVDKAKGLLMHRLELNEEEAFKKIQKQSMEKRKSMKEIAESIIIAYEL